MSKLSAMLNPVQPNQGGLAGKLQCRCSSLSLGSFVEGNTRQSVSALAFSEFGRLTSHPRPETGLYRAANGRASTGTADPFPGLRRAEKPSPEKGCPSAGPSGASGPAHLPCPQPRRCRQRSMDWYPFEWYPYLSIGMDVVMEWIGIQCIGVHSIPMQFIPGPGAVPTPVGGKGQPNHGVVSLQFR